MILLLTENLDVDEYSLLPSSILQGQAVFAGVVAGAVRDDQEGHGVDDVHMTLPHHVVDTHSSPGHRGRRSASDGSTESDGTTSPHGQTLLQIGIQFNIWGLCWREKQASEQSFCYVSVTTRFGETIKATTWF